MFLLTFMVIIRKLVESFKISAEKIYFRNTIRF